MKYTLVTDGRSDRTLMPIIDWLIDDIGYTGPINGTWADFSFQRRPPVGLHQRVVTALMLYPCDVLFVHRDAEGESVEHRVDEIGDAQSRLSDSVSVVPIVPVRMTEAWLLIDESAIRMAAGNPNGRGAIELPRLRQLEQLPDPKEQLYRCLQAASGLTGRRLKNFRPQDAVHRIGGAITQYPLLRELNAFVAFETRLRQVLDTLTPGDS
jgi:hypothetical protein